MNSFSKVPPHFIPTLTEVVQSEVATDDPVMEGLLKPEQERFAEERLEPALPAASAVRRPSFHSPWLSDGLYVRSKPATIPHELPPLPESLPPQQPFADLAVQEQARQASPDLRGPEAEFFEAKGFADFLGASEQVGKGVANAAAQTLPDSLAFPALDVLADDIQLMPEDSADRQTTSLGAGRQALGLDEQSVHLAQERLIQRLMERVDKVLEDRVRQAIAQVVEVQTRSMVLRLRQDVESVVRQSVCAALEAELSSQGRE